MNEEADIVSVMPKSVEVEQCCRNSTMHNAAHKSCCILTFGTRSLLPSSQHQIPFLFAFMAGVGDRLRTYFEMSLDQSQEKLAVVADLFSFSESSQGTTCALFRGSTFLLLFVVNRPMNLDPSFTRAQP